MSGTRPQAVLLASGGASLLFFLTGSFALVPLVGTGAAARLSVIALFLVGAAAGMAVPLRVQGVTRRSPARWEIARAAWGAGLYWLAPFISSGLSGVGPSGSPGYTTVLRWVLAGILILPLGFLSILPVSGFLRTVSLERGTVPGRLGVSGGSLLTGAAGGLAVGGFLLFPWSGGGPAVWVGLSLALLAAAGLRTPGGDRSAEPEPRATSAAGSLFSGLLAGLAGFVLGSASVVWVRTLGLLFGPTWRTSITAGLVILLALSIGFLLAGRTSGMARGHREAIPLVAHLLGALGLIGGVFFLEPLSGLLPGAFALPGPVFPLVRIAYSAAFLLFIASGAGAAILIHAVPPGPGGIGGGGSRSALPAALWGCAAGILIAAWVFLPALGGRRTLLILFLMQMSAAGLWAVTRVVRRPGMQYGVVSGLGIGAVLGVMAAPAWSPGILISGIYRYPAVIASTFASGSEFLDLRRESPPVFFHEGRVGTVAVERSQVPGRGGLFLTVDGSVVESWSGDMLGPALTGHMGLLLRPAGPDPPKVVLLGLGAGVTARAVLLHGVDSLTVVEPEGGVVESFGEFAEIAGFQMGDPRVNLVRGDPRSWLVLSAAETDLLISGGPEPWLQRGGPFHTREFFRQCRRHLTEEGLQVHRIPLIGLRVHHLRSILRAFLEVYPEVAALELTTREILLIGSGTALRFDIQLLRERMADPAVANSLLALGIPARISILGRFMAGREDLSLFTSGSRPFRDRERPTLDLPRSLSPQAARELTQLLDEVGTRVVPLLAGVGESEDDGRFLLQLGKTFIARGAFRLAEDIAQAIALREEVESGIWLRGQLAYQTGDRERAISLWESTLEIDPVHLDTLVSLGGYYQEFDLYNAAEPYLKQLSEAYPERILARFFHGKNLYFLLQDDAAIRELEEVVRLGGLDRYPITLYYVGMIAKRGARSHEAIDHLRRYLEAAYDSGQLTLVEANAHLALSEVYRRVGSEDLAEQQREAGQRLMEQILQAIPGPSE